MTNRQNFITCHYRLYLSGLQGAGHQCRHAADVSEDSLAADIGPPWQVPQDAGHHLMQLLIIRGQLGHQSLQGALLGAQSGLEDDQHHESVIIMWLHSTGTLLLED